MKKKIILRGLLGLPLGMAIGDVIAITSSFFWGQGNYTPCVPLFVDAMGSELYAVALQTFLCAILGAVSAMGSVIWEMDAWSIAKQTGLYFVLLTAVMMPIAYITGWMERSVAGAVSYFGMFVIIFIMMWLIQYFIVRSSIRKINRGIRKE